MTQTATAGTVAAQAAVAELLSPAGQDDPYPAYDRLRAAAPVFVLRPGTCFVTGYEDCRTVLGSENFAVQDPAWFDARQPEWRDRAARRHLYQGIQSRNPPDHTRIRRVVAGEFGPRRMRALVPRIERIVDELLAGLAADSAGREPVDLMEGFAFPLPIAVVGDLLGVPAADRAQFRRLTGAYLGVMDLFVTEQASAAADEAARELGAYWRRLLADRAARPADDLTSRIAAATGDGTLTEDEAVSTLMFLFSAGYGTTAALVGNAVHELLRVPDDGRRVAADPALAANAIEETLRYDSPGQIAARVATRDVVLSGVDLPAGQHLTLLLGAGNRDPARFDDPGRFDVDRPDPRPLSFGGGIHYCLGAPLSRIEAVVAVPRVLRALASWEPAGPVVRRRGLQMRIYRELPVLLRPAS